MCSTQYLKFSIDLFLKPKIVYLERVETSHIMNP